MSRGAHELLVQTFPDDPAVMKILVNAATARVGGALTHLASFLPYLVESGRDHTFTLVLPHESRHIARKLDLEIITHRHPAGSFRLRADFEQVEVRRLARKTDVLLSVVNNGPVATSCPQILWARNLLYFTKLPLGWAPRLNRWAALKTMNSAARVVFPTHAIRRAAENFGFHGQSVVLAHPLELRTIGGAWKRPSDHHGPIRILVPTSSDPHKNLALLPRVSANLTEKNVEHVIHVTAAGFELGPGAGRIVSIDRYALDRLASLAAGYDVALIPSLLESFSYSLLEMEALGLPIAASRIPAHQEVRARAELFDPMSPAAAAAAVLSAIDGWAPLSSSESERLRLRHDPSAYASRVLALAAEVVGR